MPFLEREKAGFFPGRLLIRRLFFWLTLKNQIERSSKPDLIPGSQNFQGDLTVGAKTHSTARDIKKIPTPVHISPAVMRNQFVGTPGLSFFIHSIPDYLYHLTCAAHVWIFVFGNIFR